MAVAGLTGALVQKETQTFGYAGFNDLGYSGMTHATATISITVATATTHTVMSANPARQYARLENQTASDYFYLYFTTATSTLEVGAGIRLDPGDNYVIGPDNLWVGEVAALASSTATATITYIEK